MAWLNYNCLLHVSGGVRVQVMFDYEEGASSSLTGGHFPLLAAVLLLVLDTGLYLLLAVYLDNVLPGQSLCM